MEDGPEVEASEMEEFASEGLLNSRADWGGVIGHELERPRGGDWWLPKAPRVSIPGTGIPRGRAGVWPADILFETVDHVSKCANFGRSHYVREDTLGRVSR